MRRLIDAETLVKRLESDIEQMKDPIAQMFTYVAINDIKREKEVPAIPLDWIRGYIDWLNGIGTEFASRDARAINAMMIKWEKEQKQPTCGPDYCEIGGTDDKA